MTEGNKENNVLTWNDAVMAAWGKIQKAVKQEYAGVFHKELRFRWKHEVYGWTEFGVTPDGDAFLVTGSHGAGDSYADFFYHPVVRKTYEPKRIQVTEEAVTDWPQIKEILRKKAAAEKSVYDFHI